MAWLPVLDRLRDRPLPDTEPRRPIDPTPQRVPAPLERPDPALMYLPRPEMRKAPVFQPFSPVSECLAGRRARFDPHRRSRRTLTRSIQDYGLDLCRCINPNHAAEIWADFLAALEEVDAASAPRPAGWFERPWYAIDPLRFFERPTAAHRLSSHLEGGFEYVRGLGFDNVALLSDPDRIGGIDPAISRAQQQGLRLIGTFDLDRSSDVRTPWLSGRDPTSPELIRIALARLTRDVSSRFAGELFHHVDRWTRAVTIPPGGVPAVHALVALFKLFLHLASSDQIAMGDSAECDLVPWPEASRALTTALLERDPRPLADVLEHAPLLGHGAVLACALEGEWSARRLADQLDGDLDRITLALACLYLLPATPIVHAGIEIGARGAHLFERGFLRERTCESPPVRTLRALNAAVAPASSHAHWLSGTNRRAAAWTIGDRTLVANFSPEPTALFLPRTCALELMEPSRAAALRAAGVDRAELELGAHGFGLLKAAAER